MNDLNKRRKWFDEYARKVALKINGESIIINRFTCPCCGYPTLNERAGWDICHICNWEDDGQDDQDASKIRGGANHGYSLDMGRDNFEKYLIMYSPDNNPTIFGGDSETEVTLKQELIAIFEEIQLRDKEDSSQHREKVLLVEKKLAGIIRSSQGI